MRRFLFTSMLLAVVLVASAQEHCTLQERVASAVERMLADYPQSTLQDIYKSFFQDRFGPGHIVPDSAKAAAVPMAVTPKSQRANAPLSMGRSPIIFPV